MFNDELVLVDAVNEIVGEVGALSHSCILVQAKYFRFVVWRKYFLHVLHHLFNVFDHAGHHVVSFQPLCVELFTLPLRGWFIHLHLLNSKVV